MKKLTPFTVVLMLVLSLISTMPSLANGGKTGGPPLSSALVSGDSTVSPASPAAPLDVTMLTTDFEPAEGSPPGFSPGFCTQNGWSALTGSIVEGQISAANPFVNTQHLRVAHDPSVGAGTYIGCKSPDIGAQPVSPTWMEVDVAISATGGADYMVNPQTLSQGLTTARVNFEYMGNIQILDDPGSGLQFVDTGVPWNIGPYTTLRIEVNPAANMINYYYDGLPIYTGVVFGGTTIEQVALLSDNWNIGDVGDFDNLRVFSGTHPTSISLSGFEAHQADIVPIWIYPLVLAGLLVLAVVGYYYKSGLTHQT